MPELLGVNEEQVYKIVQLKTTLEDLLMKCSTLWFSNENKDEVKEITLYTVQEFASELGDKTYLLGD